MKQKRVKKMKQIRQIDLISVLYYFFLCSILDRCRHNGPPPLLDRYRTNKRKTCALVVVSNMSASLQSQVRKGCPDCR